MNNQPAGAGLACASAGGRVADKRISLGSLHRLPSPKAPWLTAGIESETVSRRAAEKRTSIHVGDVCLIGNIADTYSITLSARANSPSGTVTPIA